MSHHNRQGQSNSNLLKEAFWRAEMMKWRGMGAVICYATEKYKTSTSQI